MIKNETQYQAREEAVRKKALQSLTVSESSARLQELIRTGWSLTPRTPRPKPVSLAQLIQPPTS